MLDFLNSFRAILTGKRLALIANTPQATALSMLFEYRIPNDLGMLTKTFSTPEAALRFVKNSPSIEAGTHQIVITRQLPCYKGFS
jgi:hypothetical protein